MISRVGALGGLARAAVMAVAFGTSACSDPRASAPASPPAPPPPVAGATAGPSSTARGARGQRGEVPGEKVRALLGKVRSADQVEIIEVPDPLVPEPQRFLLRREQARSKEGAVVPDPILDAGRGRTKALRMLLAAGADPDRGDDNSGSSPLHFAASAGHIEAVRLLLESGATPDALDLFATSPLAQAAQRGHAEVVQALLKHGARSGIQAALMAACNGGHADVARLLIEAGGSGSCPTPGPR